MVALIISVIAIVQAKTANNLSEKSNIISEESRKDIRAIERLDLEPQISVHTEFRTFGTDGPHISITNLGPIDAIHVEVQYNTLIYDSYKKVVNKYLSGSDMYHVIEKLEVLKSVQHPLDKNWVELNSKLNIPVENNIIELCILYKREPDRKTYMKRAFYFLNPEGRWVSESAALSFGGELKLLIKAAHKSDPCKLSVRSSTEIMSDILHPIQIK